MSNNYRTAATAKVQYQQYLRRKKLSNSPMALIMKYFWLIPVAFLLAWSIPTLKRLIDRMDEKEDKNQLSLSQDLSNAQNNTLNPVIQKQKGTIIQQKYPKVNAAKWQSLHSSAQLIAQAFGTDPENNHKPFNGLFNFFNVSAWTEDEVTAVRELKKHPGTFDILAELYYSVYTKSCNLKADCYEYLSASQIEELRASYKPYINL